MVLKAQRVTVEEFDKLVFEREYRDHEWEYIAGEIVDVVSHPKASKIGARFARYIGAFVDDNDLGHVTGADGGYQVGGDRYIPDVGYISKERMPELESHEGYLTKSPDLAIEVLSPTDTPRLLSIKVSNYLAAGTVVWVVDPDEQEASIHYPGESVMNVREDGIIDGGEVLPGFKLKLERIFK